MFYPQLTNVKDLQQQYDRGYRDFRQSKLQSIDLSKCCLSKIDLTQSELNDSNLAQGVANLTDADLSSTQLDRAIVANVCWEVSIVDDVNLSRASWQDRLNLDSARIVTSSAQQVHGE